MYRHSLAAALALLAGIACAADPKLPPRNALTDFTSLHAFSGADGQQPDAELVFGPDGNLYGTTEKGGANGLGTVFRMALDGTVTTLHAFSGPEGAAPTAGLMRSREGGFYGVASRGGPAGSAYCNAIGGCGTVFHIARDGRFTLLHAFDGDDGAAPSATLLEARDGRRYGTTRYAGPNGGGSVFRLEDDGSVTTLLSPVLNGIGGDSPRAPLVEAADGRLWGTLMSGGFDCGAAFALDSDGKVALDFPFNEDGGCSPLGGLVLGRDGLLRGTTVGGGWFNGGTIYQIDSVTLRVRSNLKNFHTFASSWDPGAALVRGPKDTFYGTAMRGGSGGACPANFGCGSVFGVNRLGHVKTLHVFGGPDGAIPTGALVAGTDGAYYGTTSSGGANGMGTVFRIAPAKRP